MIRFMTKVVHKCAFCGRETESYDDIYYYAINICREHANAITQSNTEKPIVEKTMCGECYNKLSLYLVGGLTKREKINESNV